MRTKLSSSRPVSANAASTSLVRACLSFFEDAKLCALRTEQGGERTGDGQYIRTIYEMGVVPAFWRDEHPDAARDVIRFPAIA